MKGLFGLGILGGYNYEEVKQKKTNKQNNFPKQKYCVPAMNKPDLSYCGNIKFEGIGSSENVKAKVKGLSLYHCCK